MTTQWNIELGLKFASVYLKCTALYGFSRAVTWDYDGTKEYYNARTRKYEVKGKLMVDKAQSVLGGTFSACYAWPFMICDDLTRLECAVKKRDVCEYVSRGTGVK